MDKYLEYKLCYVDNIDDWNTFEVFFTDKFDDQWGDDWDDRPADCNAGEPYEDENHHIISIIVRFTGAGDTIFGGKIFSAEDMNTGKACWLMFENVIFNGGTTLSEMLDRIRKYNELDDRGDIQVFLREENN